MVEPGGMLRVEGALLVECIIIRMTNFKTQDGILGW